MLFLGGQGTRSDLAVIAERIRGGSRLADLDDGFAPQIIKYGRGLLLYRNLHLSGRSWKTRVHWLFGDTGTGKTRYALQQAPTAYWKPISGRGENWWDGYDGQDDVIIDEFRPEQYSLQFLLQLFDCYPMQVPFKGGFIQFRARRIFLTCPLPPRRAFSSTIQEDYAQLDRRIEFVASFSGGTCTIIRDEATLVLVQENVLAQVPVPEQGSVLNEDEPLDSHDQLLAELLEDSLINHI